MTPMLGSKLRRGLRCNPDSMHLRALVPLLLLLALVAGCGGGGGDEADSSTDVDALLKDTFSGSKAIDSGRLDVKLGVETDTGDPLTIKLSGPFVNEGENRLPRLAFNASLDGNGQSMSGGLVSTGDRGFVSFGGETYEISGPIFEQFKAGYEQAAKQGTEQSEDKQSLAALGIDPRRWLTNAKNAGEAKVGDTDTIKITGDVDVDKLLDDVNGALEKIRALGVQGTGELPEKLTEEEKRQTAEAVENLGVEIYTGAEDRILRRIVVTLGLKAPAGTTQGGASTADVNFDLQLLDVNEDQEIKAPENAKPFDELMSQLEALGVGGLGGLGGALGGAGGGGNPSVEGVQEYSECVQKAGSDSNAVRKCADLLATP
jgi:hypothetical protein